MSMSELMELHQLAVEQGRSLPKKRALFDTLAAPTGRHYVGIVGPRGVGKTVLLKQLAAQTERSFYLSADTLNEEDLFETIKQLHEDYGFSTFLLDEIHFYRGFEATLKKLYDFLKIKVFFSSSVALAIVDSSYDLSRRVVLSQLAPFSLREYAYFKKDLVVPALTLVDIQNKTWQMEHLHSAPLFESYLRGGLMPFALEELNPLQILANILNKILHKDIPAVARLQFDDVDRMEKLVKFIGRSEVDGINYSSLSQNLKITKYKAAHYVRLLEQSFVLQTVLPAGTNVMKEPKVLLSLPYRLLYRSYDEAIGGLREDFFAEMMRIAGQPYHYLKTTRGAKTPDFLVTIDDRKLCVEIGGKSKGRSQFKGIEVDEKLILSHSDSTEGLNRPLYLLGLLGSKPSDIDAFVR